MKQRLRPTERLSHFLQIEDETARGVAANQKMFHGWGSFGGESCRCAAARVNSANYVRSITEGFRDSEAQAELDWRSSLNKLVADGVENEVAEGMEIELEHDSGAVTLNRSRADQQFRAYFSVRLADGQKRNDLAFARR